MKNFITLLFVIISFNSIFSQIQSVEIYDHINDMNLIKEVGANSIRLAHYQHDQFFYDLCDKE